jgi:hypothetical protein
VCHAIAFDHGELFEFNWRIAKMFKQSYTITE